MKRKLTLAIGLLACMLLTLNAAPRSAKEALKVARSFYAGKSLLRSTPNSDFRLVYTGEKSGLRSTSADPYYYIYNVGETGGFVMVSGDDRLEPVIGYSLGGSFDPEHMPSNLKGWFAEYERQIDYILETGKGEERMENKEVSTFNSPFSINQVEPLITAKWDQFAPYNDLCPQVGDERMLTGCVATAMAQIMYYHKWPEKSVGQGSYTIPEVGTDTTYVDLEGISFDWANMTDTYDPTSTAAQRKAVAELMYAAGVSAKMMYGSYDVGSGALSSNASEGLIRNMGYDPKVSYLLRSIFTREEWHALMKSELAQARPILYTGVDQEGGHAFVCDGYDADDFFHINWGWSGQVDGYFLLDLLNPDNTEISGYSLWQEAIVGIQKPTEQSKGYQEMRILALSADEDELVCGDTLAFNMEFLYCGSLPDSNMRISIDLFSENRFVRNLSVGEVQVSPGNTLSFNGLYPDFRLDPGTYDLKVRYRFAGESEWREMERSKDMMYDHLRLLVEGTAILWVGDDLELSGDPLVVVPLGDDGFGATVWGAKTMLRNESELYGDIPLYLHLLSAQMDTTFRVVGTTLAPGEEKQVKFLMKLQLEPGTYQVELQYWEDLGSDDNEADDEDADEGEEEEDDEGLMSVEGTASTLVVPDKTTAIDTPAGDAPVIRVAAGRLWIESALPVGRVRVYDRSGRCVASGIGKEVAIPGLSSGVYFLRMEVNRKTEVVKFRIQDL